MPRLPNYQLGDSLGKGAFGQVYRALNWATGETVAIKQISLNNIPASQLSSIMSEISLLKNLRHPNIVKYKGFVKTRMHLYIILEFCENGSLSQIGKRFGKFPEGLVGVYVSQVLEGLCYLHEQGVIHRDIKGANILTNKDGTVKLADFGVASSTTVPSGSSSADVVGSPYWMAPEVIEQSGATTASDIWSLGCVVIELLEGSPPYSFLDPMPALWRIVQDDCPPIPEGASAVVKDFLACCFQKDPNLRIGARKLLRHPWMAKGQQQASSRKGKNAKGDPQRQARPPKHTSNAYGGTEARPVSQYGYDEAVQRVQEWNQALSSAANLTSLPTSTSTGIAFSKPQSLAVPVPTNPIFNAKGSGSAGSIPTIRPPSLLSPNLTPSSSASSSSGSGSSLDQGKTIRPIFTAPPFATNDSSDTKPQSNRRDVKGKGKGPTLITPSLNPLSSALGGLVSVLTEQRKQLAFVEEEDEANPNWDDDFDLGEEDDDFAARSKIEATKSRMDDRSSKNLISGHNEEAINGTSSDATLTSSSKTNPFLPSLSRLPISASSSNPPSSQLSPSLRMTRSASDTVTGASSNTTYYAISEAEEENYDDDFLDDEDGVDEALLEKRDDNDSPASTVGSGEGGFKLERPGLLKLNSRLSNRSWAAVEDDSSDEDVFAEFDEPFAEDDLEAHIQRDKQARLSARVNTLIDDLSFNANSTGTLLINSTGVTGEMKDGREAKEDRLRNTVGELLNILVASPEMQIQLVSSHGMLAILEVLEGYHVSSGLSASSREIVLQLLRIVNLLVTENVSFLESFCLVGGIPVVMGFTSKRFPSECRLEASNFIRLLCHTSVLTLQMFISCRGLKVLVELLDEDCSSATQAPLVVHALNGISSVFDLQSPTTKNDFCRMFVREGLLDPLSGALLNVMANVNATSGSRRDEGENRKDEESTDGAGLESGMKEKIIRILLVFSQVSQSDSYVRHAVGTRKVIRRLLRACELLEPGCLVLMLKAVKHLSMNVSLLDVLQNANAIEILVRILEEQASSPHSTEMSNHIFQTCFNLCRLNKSRQEEAAQAGIIPCLQRVAETQSPLKQFALPILCDMASAGKSCRMLLWQHNGLNMYLRLLEDPYFQVSALESILSWLQDEPARVEDELMKPDAMRAILDCFVTAKANSFENLLELFLKLTRISTRITTAFSRSTAFFRKVADRLGHNTKPVMRLNLLRILKSVCDAHPNRGILVERYGSGDGLLGVLEGLSRGGGDGAVLVRELAKEIIPVLRPGLKPLPVGSRAGGKGVTPKRMRRTASETSALGDRS
ncbi:kinase-like protein [Lentinula raphanica]|nr:kinase-like protein [Lentinula raphanica]